MQQVFEWDPDKAASNLRKHRVSFEQACRVFIDPYRVLTPDPFEEEDRWQAIGRLGGMQLLVVVHTSRYMDESGTLQEVIRIISARHANREESNTYERQAG